MIKGYMKKITVHIISINGVRIAIAADLQERL